MWRWRTAARLAVLLLGAGGGAPGAMNAQGISAADSALMRRLGREAFALAKTLSKSERARIDTIGLLDNLVSMQLEAGDYNGAIETARTLDTLALAWDEILTKQVELGDTARLRSLIAVAPERLLGTLAYVYLRNDSLDRAVEVAHQFGHGVPLASALLYLTEYMLRQHPQRARELLAETDALIPGDSTAAARHVAVGAAVIHIRLGDWTVFDAMVTAARTPEHRAELWTWLLNSPNTPAGAKSDSILHLALTVSDSMVDSAQRARVQASLEFAIIYSAAGSNNRAGLRLAAVEARTPEMRAEALRRLMLLEVRTAKDIPAALRVVDELEGFRPPRAVAWLLVDMIDWSANPSDHVAMPIDSTLLAVLARAFAIGYRVGPAFGDTLRGQAVSVLARRDLDLARSVFADIHAPALRDRAHLSILQEMLAIDVPSAMAEGSRIATRAVADSVLVLGIDHQLTAGRLSDAMATAATIRTPQLRSRALSAIGYAQRVHGQDAEARRSYRTALSLLDPLQVLASPDARLITRMIDARMEPDVLAWIARTRGVMALSARITVMNAIYSCRETRC